MKNLIRYFKLIFGCILVAIAIDFIIIPNNLLTFGINGLSVLLYYLNGINPAFNILLLNLIVVFFGLILLGKDLIKEYIIPSLLIPVFVYLLMPLQKVIVLELPEMMLVIIVAGFLMGLGYSIIYKQGFSIGTTYLFEELVGILSKFHSYIYS